MNDKYLTLTGVEFMLSFGILIKFILIFVMIRMEHFVTPTEVALIGIGIGIGCWMIARIIECFLPAKQPPQE